MEFSIKDILVRSQTTVITLEHHEKTIPKDELFALAILLGDYNKFGRSIPVEQYREIRSIFNNCITEVKELINPK